MNDALFRVRARFALLVDHFALTQESKPILVGVFDRVFVAPNAEGKLVFPSGYLAIKLEAPFAAGPDHQLQVKLVDEQGAEVFELPALDVHLKTAGEGFGLRSTVAMQLLAVEVPKHGYYEWRILIDGLPVTEAPFRVEPMPERRE